jgi:hypothetical protein
MAKLKLTRKIKTLDDLFARSDVNDTIEQLVSTKKDITDLVMVYKTSDGSIWYSYAIDDATNQDEMVKVLGLIEYAKNMILNPNIGCEDDN